MHAFNTSAGFVPAFPMGVSVAPDPIFGMKFAPPPSPYSSAPGVTPSLSSAYFTPPPSIQSSASSRPPLRPNRKPRDLAQIKAERRMEIERRCRELDPPLMPSTLAYMEAYQVAIGIPMVLNDNAWNLLKTRLLSQRTEAELREQEHLAQLQSRYLEEEERKRQEEHLRLARERLEHEKSQAKRPIQEKLQKYAIDFVNVHWNRGHAITYNNCPQFAAEILQHVRQQFYNPQTWDGRTLLLEDMKVLYKDTIQRYVKRFREDLFLCRECNNGKKRFVFDSIIQHHAAKHTDVLSNGTIVVYWKSKWPEEPPFDPNPIKDLHRNSLPSAPPAECLKHSPVAGSSLSGATLHGDEVTAIAQKTWFALDYIKGMSSSLRLYVTLNQVVIQYQIKYKHAPSIPLLVDCVGIRAELEELKNVGNLRCGRCLSSSSVDDPRNVDYEFLELLEHFHIQHEEAPQRSRGTIAGSGSATEANWNEDIIWLPDVAYIKSLLHAPGIDYRKLNLIATVLPQHFPRPLPDIDPIPYEIDVPVTGRAEPAEVYYRTENRTISGSFLEHDIAAPHTSRCSTAAGADEYDPQRPGSTMLPHTRHESVWTSAHKSTRPAPPQGFVYHKSTPAFQSRPLLEVVDPNKLLHTDERYRIRQPIVITHPPSVTPSAYPQNSYRAQLGQGTMHRDKGEHHVRSRPLSPVPVRNVEPGMLPKQGIATPSDSMTAAEKFLDTFDFLDDEKSHSEHGLYTSNQVDERYDVSYQERQHYDHFDNGYRSNGGRALRYDDDIVRSRPVSSKSTPRPRQYDEVVEDDRHPTRSHQLATVAFPQTRDEHNGFHHEGARRTYVEQYQNGLPLRTAVDDERYIVERTVPFEPQYRRILEPVSPVLHYRQVSQVLTRYREVLPDNQIHYSKDDHLVDEAVEPFEYVRVPLQEDRYSTPRYYVERPGSGYPPRYVQYEPLPTRHPVYEDERPRYSRMTATPQNYYEPDPHDDR